MKNLFLLLGLVLAANALSQTSMEEFDEQFQSQIGNYLIDGGLTFSLTKAHENTPAQAGVSILLKICKQGQCDHIKNFGPNLEASILKPFSIRAVKLKHDLNADDVTFSIEARKGGKLLASKEVVAKHIIRSLIFGAKKEVIKIHDLLNYDLNITIRTFQNGIRPLRPQQVAAVTIDRPLLLLDVLSKDTFIKDLMAEDAGVSEGYTIKEHNLRVLARLETDYSCYFPAPIEARFSKLLGTPVKNFMRATMALHDIGKPLAVKAGDKHRQHEFTRPIAEMKMTEYGFKPQAVKVASSLIDNDLIGDYLQGRISLHVTLVELVKLATFTNLGLDEYFHLQMAFYTADAGAYPYLAEKVFTIRDGCFVPRSRKYEELLAHIYLSI
jgi:hypothetical protein